MPGFLTCSEAASGTLWIGADNVLRRWNEQTRQVEQFPPPANQFRSNIYSIYHDRNGVFWVLTHFELLRRKEEAWVAYPINPSGGRRPTPMLLGQFGWLWVTTGDLEWSRFRDGQFTAIGTKDELSTDLVTSVCEDRKGNLWLGKHGGGLNRMRPVLVQSFNTTDGLDEFLLAEVTANADFVVEGHVDPPSRRYGGTGPREPLRDEGPFGDHAGPQFEVRSTNYFQSVRFFGCFHSAFRVRHSAVPFSTSPPSRTATGDLQTCCVKRPELFCGHENIDGRGSSGWFGPLVGAGTGG